MNQAFFTGEIFKFFGRSIKGGDVVIGFFSLLLVLFFYVRYRKKVGQYLFRFHQIDRGDLRKFHRYLYLFFILLLVWIVLGIVGVDAVFMDRTFLYLTLQNILLSSILLVGGLLAAWVSEQLFREYYMRKKDGGKYFIYDERNEAVMRWVGRTFVFLFSLSFVFELIHFNPEWTLSVTEKDGETFKHTLSLIRVLGAIKIILLVRLALWFFLHMMMRKLYESKALDDSHRYAINRLIKYFVYLITISVIFEYLGFNLTLLWGSLAALMVGVGLGLQDFIRDFVSGIMLLFERSVGVGDTIEIDGKLGRVLSIGTRVSMIETNFKATLMVPNSKLVNNTILNWSYVEPVSRLVVEVNVAYGSDIPLVQKLMIEAAMEQEEIIKDPPPIVLFTDFGENGLLFKLVYLAPDAMIRPFIASNIRYLIDQKFRNNNIEIPFPQRDIHIIKNKKQVD